MLDRYAGDGVGWMLAVMLVIAVLLIGLATVVVVWMVRGRESTTAVPSVPASGSSSTARAHAILDERFARGEIDEAEYRSRRTALEDRNA